MRPDWTTIEELSHRQHVLSMLDELPKDGLGVVSSQHIADRITAAAGHLSGGGDPSARAVAVYSPGRIELVGKHTDYAGGSSLTCASQRSFCMVACAAPEPGVQIEDLVSGNSAFISFESDSGNPGPGWTAYPSTVLRRYCANFGVPETGMSLVFSSDIPRASGMSSSSSFVIGTWMCIAALSEVTRIDSFRQNIQTGADLASYMGCVENGYSFKDLDGDAGVGTMGGAQDHTAILFSDPRTLGHFQYRPLVRLEGVSIPSELTFVIASSGVRAPKTTGAKEDYNNTVQLAARSVDIWSKRMGGVRGIGEEKATLRDTVTSGNFSLDAFEVCVEKEEADVEVRRALLNRVRQFIEETQTVIPGVIKSLQTGDYESLQNHVSRSQQMADEWLGNQVPETRYLVETAREHGAVASSAFGAGFGGSVWALVPSKNSARFLMRWFAAYGRSFQHRLRKAYFFQEKTGPGTFVLGVDPESLLFKSNF